MSDPQTTPWSAGADIGLLGIDHVGIAVPDLDAAIDFYRRTFGLRCLHRERYPSEGLTEAMLGVGADRAATAIQLLGSLHADSTIGRFLDRHGPGLQQLALRVGDVEAASAALRAAGVPPMLERAARGTAGSLVTFIHPKLTGGVLIELVQRTDLDPDTTSD